MANYFGIESWFYKSVEELSGGQKQLLNLASVMARQPEVLILDEPTAQLDPIAAGEFLATLKKLNEELGTTILLIEQRLEEAFAMADRVLALEDGRVLFYGVIMDTASLLMYSGEVTVEGLLAMYASGLPFNLIHAASTVVFLWVLYRPMAKKLRRVRLKYGLL